MRPRLSARLVTLALVGCSVDPSAGPVAPDAPGGRLA